jgi:hypothetical protein
LHTGVELEPVDERDPAHRALVPELASREEKSMSSHDKSHRETDADGEALEVGNYYEVVHGPASSPERTTAGRLIKIDVESSVFTFELDDGSEITVADDAIDGARRMAPE